MTRKPCKLLADRQPEHWYFNLYATIDQCVRDEFSVAVASEEDNTTDVRSGFYQEKQVQQAIDEVQDENE